MKIKKALVLFLFLTGFSFLSNAQNTNVSLVITTIGGEEFIYQMTEESQLYFAENGESLVIEDGLGNVETFQLASIRKIECSETTGTQENTLSELQLFPNPSRGNFIIKNLIGSHPARIYSLDGRLMRSFKATEGAFIDISDLSRGMYLLHINGQTLKLMKL